MTEETEVRKVVYFNGYQVSTAFEIVVLHGGEFYKAYYLDGPKTGAECLLAKSKYLNVIRS